MNDLVFLQEDDKQAAVDAMYNDNLNKQCLLNVEYKKDGVDYVSLLFADNKVSGILCPQSSVAPMII